MKEMKKYFIRGRRYLYFLAQFFLYEKPNGLDFDMRDTAIYKESAAKCSFQKVDGIEIQSKLVKTARKNFQILGIADRVHCIHADAAEFEHYEEYNIFFLFNPFPAEILEKVIKRIIESRSSSEQIFTVIYHKPQFLRSIEDNVHVLEKEILFDPLKDYETCILRLKPLEA